MEHPELPRKDASRERGMALVVVLLVIAVFFTLAVSLLFVSGMETVVAINEQDHAKAFSVAGAGMAWVERRVEDSTNMSDLLNGPNNGSTSDDNLIGLRSLALGATSSFTSANEGTASAIVSRDFFGAGSKNYEALRFADGSNTRALVYVRVDDNYDDDPDNPANNVPLTDTDGTVKATVVAEFPIFVNGSGVEVANTVDKRGKGRRALSMILSKSGSKQNAIATDGDLDLTGSSLKICGECGNAHANQNIEVIAGVTVCGDATASGSYSGSTSGVQGIHAGGQPVIPIPDISPYDTLFVPNQNVFDESYLGGDFAACGSPVATGQPGNAKYFALVADNNKGKVFKAYWDNTDGRWEWRMIDDLNDGTEVELDNCGRYTGDTGYDASKKVNDTKIDEFYGWKRASSPSSTGCSSCGSSGGDVSLCTLANNDFGKNGYRKWTDNSWVASGSWGTGEPNLPGDSTPDGTADFVTTSWMKDGTWDYSGSSIYSPLYGAVLFIYGSTKISGNPGNTGSVSFCKHSGCSTALPGGFWRVSIISYSSIEISGQANIGPANNAANYGFLLISGRDISISGNPQQDSVGCSGSCPNTAPGDIASIGGIYASHEQIQISGNPSIFGFMIAETALDCSTTVDDLGSSVSILNGSPQILYDCDNPPNPWATPASTNVLSWQEIE